MSKTQSRNSMAKSHELPDIDKLEENRGTINQQIDRKSKMQSIAFCLSHLIDDYSFCKYAENLSISGSSWLFAIEFLLCVLLMLFSFFSIFTEAIVIN